MKKHLTNEVLCDIISVLREKREIPRDISVFKYISVKHLTKVDICGII